MISDKEILRSALVGLHTERAEIDRKIKEVELRLSGEGGAVPSPANPAMRVKKAAKRRKRVLSAEARARIAAAQKKRWAAIRKAKKV